MSRARADFECAHCAKVKGVDFVHIENLPLTSKRCPHCGHARGFKRLFNAINVNSRHSNHKRRYIDRKLEPAYAQHSEVEAGAKRYEEATKKAQEMAWEQTPSKVREAAAAVNPAAVAAARPGGPGMPRHMPASQAMGMIDPQARRDTATHIYPALTGQFGGNPNGRRVVPAWEK